MIRLFLPTLLTMFLIGGSTYANAETAKPDATVLTKLFNDWTDAFNRKDIAATCRLYAPNVTATFQGLPPKNYDIICDGFKRLFAEKNKHYQDRFDIHDIYQSENLAAVRITWYLDIQENGHKLSLFKDEGMDILAKDQAGNWKIINYLAFPVIQGLGSMS